MADKQFAPNDMIFSEGDISDVAYIVKSGKVQISKHSAQGEIILATLEAGGVFGEEALFSGGKRTNSARATAACEVDAVSGSDYKSMLTSCAARLVPLVTFAMDRLKNSIQLSTPAEKMPAAVGAGDLKRVMVTPTSDNLKRQFEKVEMPIARLPLNIGGYPIHNEAARYVHNHLNIASDGPPLTISKQHCVISTEEDGVYLIDQGSRFGTVVNGSYIGRGRGIYKAPLKKGENEVRLGGPQSAYVVSILCE